MATVALSQVKLGDKISEDVLTPLGGVLFQKGRVITLRELDIMQAFLVSKVSIEQLVSQADKGQEDAKHEIPSHAPTVSATPLHDEYDQMIHVLKRVNNEVRSGQPIPVMDVRNQLEKMIQYEHSYQVLTFMPRKFAERDYLLHNSVLVALTSYRIAQWTGQPRKDWVQVALAGLLHDIGNIKIDPAILAKPTALTSEENEEMKRHTVFGYQLLKNIASLNEGVKLTALQHHERIDGSGYPLAIDSTKIHPYAKIVAIADIYHAMTLNRYYRKAASPYFVLEQIQSDSFGKLEPAYVRVFVEKVTQFHNGTIVKLSDDRVGEIVFTDAVHPTRPWVSVGGAIINLTTERNLHIQEVLG
ncbi:HD-GYP domain-containing protein [Paenibacillus glycanilyticus]|uniref:HD family phosphohydrolase n=1 Tax=Paenibacillus glycanilyticus TaxID=126569 RepID=A0ABQ6GKT2_9BACL|nr:HD-GYP domain-containing protein [Paenibacillus glycanilyticus]GLX71539.1 HD family phosphohydrolase [Paenibacillus glycanilyticus]